MKKIIKFTLEIILIILICCFIVTSKNNFENLVIVFLYGIFSVLSRLEGNKW